MKAITLTAPYSWLVVAGFKKYETRSWATAHRGSLAIHTAQGLGPVGGERGLLELCKRLYFREALDLLNIDDPLARPRGVIDGTVELVDCRRMIEPSTEEQRPGFMPITRDPIERAFGYWFAGRWAWKLARATMFDQPIPAKGAQGLWNWEQPVDHSLLTPANPAPAVDIRRPIAPRKPASFT
jgi:hypothetical protein